MNRLIIAIFISTLCSILLAEQALPKSKEEWTIPKVLGVLRAETESLESVASSRAVRETPGTMAARAATTLGQPAIDAIGKLLDDESKIVRLNALWALTQFRSLPAESASLKSLKDRDAEVRATAVRYLQTITDTNIRRAIIDVLSDADESVRWNALSRLQFHGDKMPNHQQISNVQRNELLNAVVRLADDPRENIRVQVAKTIGSHNNRNATPHLLKLLSDQSVDVRIAAVDGLGSSGNRQASPDLLKALTDKNELLVGHVAVALGQLEEPLAVVPLLALVKKTTLRRPAAEALGRIGDRRAVPTLIELIDDADARTRIAVFEALGRIGDVRAVEPLIDHLKKKPADTQHLARPLGSLNDARAVEPLVKAMFADSENQYVTDAVTNGLQLIRDPSVVKLLAEHAVRKPETFAGFEARRFLGRKLSLGSPFDADAFEAWWQTNKKLYSSSEEKK